MHVGNSPIIGLFPKITCILNLLNSLGRPAFKIAEESTKLDRVFVPETNWKTKLRVELDVSNVSLVLI